jgi:hypothetical protein
LNGTFCVASGGMASRSPGRTTSSAAPEYLLEPLLVIMFITPAECPPNSAENWLVMIWT